MAKPGGSCRTTRSSTPTWTYRAERISTLAPALRLGFLAGLVSAVVFSEGSAGYLGILAALGAGQTLLWWLLLYGLAPLWRRIPLQQPGRRRSPRL